MKKQMTLFLTIVFGAGSFSLAADETALIEQGRKVYGMQCVRCHGPEGKGDGMDARRIPVAPRNLVDDEYKFKTTEYGTPPSDEDLLRVLNHGMSGSGMPSFANLTDDVKESLVAYIKSISSSWGSYAAEPIAPPNEKVKVNLVRGKEIFDKLQCALCHGTNGRANGTSAAGLKVRPANLTQGWRYKAGHTAKDIYFRLMSGIAGSGMPSYKDGFPNEDLWQLASYVASLQLDPNWDFQVVVTEVEGDLPTTFDDPAWGSAKQTDVALQGSVYRWGKREFSNVHHVSVQAVANEKEISFRLFWNDPTENVRSRVDSFYLAIKPDIMKGSVRDNLHTLYPPGANPLEIVRWEAGEPNTVTEGSATLHQASQPNWKGAQSGPASAQYEDGAWKLVFTRSLSHRPSYIGLAAQDGENREIGLKKSASQWVALTFGERELSH